jgi:acetyl-CoA carboxylase biotin carboxyl carrier protein
MDVNFDKIRELADLAIEKNLAEVTVQDGDRSVTIKLPVAQGTAAQHVVYAPQPPVEQAKTSAQASQTKTAGTDEEDRYHKITSPMVGTFYSAPSPSSPPFVKTGDSISKGQVLCIIEAMKMMNELESEVAGTVVKILVNDAQPVEFGQVLMLVDPNG